jgi:hypothetical protein
VWSADGREIFFRNGEEVLAVSVETEPELSIGTPRLLFQGPYRAPGGTDRDFDVSPDGRRFVMVSQQGSAPASKINIVLNWFEELKQLVPTK